MLKQLNDNDVISYWHLGKNLKEELKKMEADNLVMFNDFCLKLDKNDSHFTKKLFVDLVFYKRLLKCYVLIDLEVDELTHQDLGQMQMYVNYYDRYEKTNDENPTVGRGEIVCW